MEYKNKLKKFMTVFDYLVRNPTIENGKILADTSLVQKTAKSIFGKEFKKAEIVRTFISEEDYLKKKGSEGWKLVTIITNSLSHDLKTYYFVREITHSDK